MWREALLAQAVLRGKTRGYRQHPQLDRFKRHAAPLMAIAVYLDAIFKEAELRGYSFDQRKIRPIRKRVTLTVTTGQLSYEWTHLMAKLKKRNPAHYRKWKNTQVFAAHSMFRVRRGEVEPWERPRSG